MAEFAFETEVFGKYSWMGNLEISMKSALKLNQLSEFALAMCIVFGFMALTSCGESAQSGSKDSGAVLEAARASLEGGNGAPAYSWCASQLDPDQIEQFQAAVQSGSVDAEARKQLKESSTVVDWAIAAAGAERSTFEVDTSQGVMALAPHYGQLRSISYLLIADSIRLAQVGDHDQSAIRVISVLRMANQIGRDVSSTFEWILGMSFAEAALERIEAMDPRSLSQQARSDLLTTLSTIDKREPLNARIAILKGGETMAYSIRNGKLPNDMQIPPGTDAERVAQAVTLLTKQIARSWTGQYAEATMEGILEGAADSDLAKFLPGSLSQMKDYESRLKARLAEAMDRLN